MRGGEEPTRRRRRRQARSGYSEWPFGSILHKRATVSDPNPDTRSNPNHRPSGDVGGPDEGLKLSPNLHQPSGPRRGPPHPSSPAAAASRSRGASSTGAGRSPSRRSGKRRPGSLEGRKS